MAYERWNRGKILNKIIYLKNNNVDLSMKNMRQNYSALLGAAEYHFGSWKDTLNASNINYQEIKDNALKWNEENIAEYIYKLKADNFILTTYILQKNNKTLYNKILKQYGNWGNFKKYFETKYQLQLSGH